MKTHYNNKKRIETVKLIKMFFGDDLTDDSYFAWLAEQLGLKELYGI